MTMKSLITAYTSKIVFNDGNPIACNPFRQPPCCGMLLFIPLRSVLEVVKVGGSPEHDKALAWFMERLKAKKSRILGTPNGFSEFYQSFNTENTWMIRPVPTFIDEKTSTDKLIERMVAGVPL
jgi:hypothetical protein